MGSEATGNVAERAIGRIERARALDRPAHLLGEAVAEPFRYMGGRGKDLRSALHGTGFGHPIHPIMTTVPLGSWTASLVFDLLEGASRKDGRRYGDAADLTMGLGCVAAVGAAVTGLVEWEKTHGEPRRVGLVHASLNTAALGLYLASLALRRRGRRGAAKATAALGFGAVAAGGYLGGHMVYRRKVGVDHADQEPRPRDFVPVLAEAGLPEGAVRRVEAEGVGVALVRHQGRVHALGARCSHLGGPLGEGWVFRGGLVCPWHGSRFCLRTGRPLDGPATAHQPRYETRVRDGMIELRRPESRRSKADLPDAGLPLDAARGGPKADEVLFRHHQAIRGLIDRIRAAAPDCPARLELLDELSGEIDMHERVEHEIFFPQVRRVTDMVPAAYSEHGQISDQLAILMTLAPATRDFDENLDALGAAWEHHARAEETVMFPASGLLGERVLRHLGAEIEDRLEDLRTSRLHRLVRLGRQALLERGRGRLGRALDGESD